MQLNLLPVVAVSLALNGCSEREPPQQTNPGAPPFLASASIIDLMSGQIDPAADALWQSVATISTKDGILQRRPRTVSEWQEQRRHSIALIEYSNLLMIPGRVVGYPGQALENPPGAGDYTPAESLAAIRKEPQMFIAFTRVLQQSALSALHAVEARDADKLLEAGGDIDAACEQCHRRFWYPAPAAIAPSSN
jgi:hypothetical protein